MKEFYLFVAYFAVKDGRTTLYGCCDYPIESEVKPKITPSVLDKITEEIKSDGGFDCITIINWKWFDDED